MNSLRSIAAWTTRAAVAGLVLLATAPTLLAAGPRDAAGQDYVKGYGLTILACVLGLFVVGRSSRRTTEVKFTDDN